jgi:hypothetical protein
MDADHTEKLAAWVKEQALPVIQKHVEATGLDVTVTVDGTNIYIDYDPLAAGTGYVPPRVKLEFGARSTGEPAEKRAVVCDAAAHLAELEFPVASPNVMLPSGRSGKKPRPSTSIACVATKATAIHVTGMIWCVWTMPITPMPRLPTRFWQRKPRNSKASSSAQRTTGAIRRLRCYRIRASAARAGRGGAEGAGSGLQKNGGRRNLVG